MAVGRVTWTTSGVIQHRQPSMWVMHCGQCRHRTTLVSRRAAGYGKPHTVRVHNHHCKGCGKPFISLVDGATKISNLAAVVGWHLALQMYFEECPVDGPREAGSRRTP